MIDIKLTRTFDYALIRGFMTSDDIWDTFTDDLSVKENYNPEFSTRQMWLIVIINGNFAGVVLLENKNLSTIAAHPCLSKAYRMHIRAVFKELFKVICNMPGYINKLSVSIPFTRKIVYNTAIKIGFISEGIDRKSFLKNGEFQDQWSLGLTRGEMKRLICQV